MKGEDINHNHINEEQWGKLMELKAEIDNPGEEDNHDTQKHS